MRWFLLIMGFFFLSGCSEEPTTDQDVGFPGGYVITLQQFDQDVLEKLEDQLVELNGYDSHRLVEATGRHIEFYYHTDQGSAELKRAIHKIINDDKLQASVRFSDNVFVIKNTAGPASEAHPSKAGDW